MSDRHDDPTRPDVTDVPHDPATAEETTMDDQHTQPLPGEHAPDETAPPRPWSGAGPAHQDPRATAPVSTDVRVGTIVWGLVLAAIGVGLLALAAGVSFDVELAFIILVALAGVGLVVGAVVAGVRRSRTRT